jgi:hypothetical protein
MYSQTTTSTWPIILKLLTLIACSTLTQYILTPSWTYILSTMAAEAGSAVANYHSPWTLKSLISQSQTQCRFSKLLGRFHWWRVYHFQIKKNVMKLEMMGSVSHAGWNLSQTRHHGPFGIASGNYLMIFLRLPASN